MRFTWTVTAHDGYKILSRYLEVDIGCGALLLQYRITTVRKLSHRSVTLQNVQVVATNFDGYSTVQYSTVQFTISILVLTSSSGRAD